MKLNRIGKENAGACGLKSPNVVFIFLFYFCSLQPQLPLFRKCNLNKLNFLSQKLKRNFSNPFWNNANRFIWLICCDQSHYLNLSFAYRIFERILERFSTLL